ncbi:HD domain-containing phosphohydrolase [Deinococcus sp.]|uniref:HD-GYP domain-containing protein n=1 Tax=Deinococcus sp. TaxID=47478 RepID=UPI002869E29E|nr:HD domain-containing phosphohydrolase [Deinococcus sp.]
MTRAPSSRLSDLTSDRDSRTSAAQSILTLTRVALAAPSLPEGITPTLQHLVEQTSAVGAAYFQLRDHPELAFHVRAAWGAMPQSAGMAHVVTHGLPVSTPLIVALEGHTNALFFDHTGEAEETAGFLELGVTSLAAAPVRSADGQLLGAFLMHTFEPHVWSTEEAALFSMVVGTIAALAGRLAAEEQVKAAHEEAVSAREAALRALGLGLEARDGETRGHTDRVTALLMALVQQRGEGQENATELRWGAYLHDIGKIAIPDAILLKPGRLTPEEWSAMQGHVSAGVEFARALGFLPEPATTLIAQHHERWDGSGYPLGLRGTQISLSARLFALCDVYDALTSARPYKAAWTHQAAVAEIQAQSGRHFDPELVALFMQWSKAHGHLELQPVAEPCADPLSPGQA